MLKAIASGSQDTQQAASEHVSVDCSRRSAWKGSISYTLNKAKGRQHPHVFHTVTTPFSATGIIEQQATSQKKDTVGKCDQKTLRTQWSGQPDQLALSDGARMRAEGHLPEAVAPDSCTVTSLGSRQLLELMAAVLHVPSLHAAHVAATPALAAQIKGPQVEAALMQPLLAGQLPPFSEPAVSCFVREMQLWIW